MNKNMNRQQVQQLIAAAVGPLNKKIDKLLAENKKMLAENKKLLADNVNLRIEISTLKTKYNRVAQRLNAIEARMYARAQSERLSAATTKKLANDSLYRTKVSKWHDRFHGRHFTPDQILQMKKQVGAAYTARIQPPGSSKGSRGYGSMKTNSLKAAAYALGRNANKSSSHGSKKSR